MPPIRLPRALPGVGLAVGAHLKNRLCLVAGDRVWWSDAHGDLSEPSACRAFDRSLQDLLAWAKSEGLPPHWVAHDWHPDFHSTRRAQELAFEFGWQTVPVQHHHAHVAAVMGAQGLSEPVLGLALDGFGLGSDGQAWGGELLRVGPDGWQRLGHLEPLRQPGGDAAAREPWRLAAAVLHAQGRAGDIDPRWSAAVPAPLRAGLRHMLDQGRRVPLSTSAGRWFDAAAAALGLCSHQAHEAQAAIALQTLAESWFAAPTGAAVWTDAPTGPRQPTGVLRLSGLLEPLWPLAHTAMREPAHQRLAAAAWAFHRDLAAALADWVLGHRAVAAVGGDTPVVLSGGCFHNRLLTGLLQQRLALSGVAVAQAGPQGPGDAGLALGQAAVASWVATGAYTPAPDPSTCLVILEET